MASISKPSRSLRRKTMPVPAAAGRIRSVTAAPLCNPMPLHSTGARSVCSNGKLFQQNRLHCPEFRAVLFFYHRTVAIEELLLFDRIDLGRSEERRVGKEC